MLILEITNPSLSSSVPTDPESFNPQPGCLTLTAASALCRRICLNLTWSNLSSRSHLYVVYKSNFHAAGNFIGVHAEGKHVIQVGGHVFTDLLPFTPDPAF